MRGPFGTGWDLGVTDDRDVVVVAGWGVNSLGGMGTWAAYTGFKQVAEAIPGGADSIDAASFMKQAAETTNLDTKGMVPVLDFTKEWTEYPDYRRLFNRTVVFSTIKDGKVVPLTTDFQDVGELALGKKPAQ